MKKESRIFSISGNPVSGKSTAIKKLIEKLREQGFSEENIHLVSTGEMFRNYFKKIINLMKNIDNEETLQEISKDEDMKRILSNPIYRKKIQDTVISLKQAGLLSDDFDIANAFTVSQLASIRHIMDEVIDSETARLGEEIVKANNPNEVWIFDSRLAFNKIPSSFAIRLTVKDTVAAERLFNDSSRGKEDSGYESLEEAREKVIERTQGEQNAYKRRYGIDLQDSNNYNLIIDTSYADVDEIAETILKCEEYDRAGKPYGKMWGSPEKFLPLQGIMETGGIGYGSGLDFDELKERIDKDGYDPGKEIEVVEVEGKFYIIEGHHRNFAVANLGKTLIPYKMSSTLDQKQAEERAKTIRLSYLYDHETAFKRKNADGTIKSFSYGDIYHNIYEEIKKQQEQEEQNQ